MSKPSKHTFTCRKCGNSFEAIIWQSINVTLDPSLKTKLMKGDLTEFKCKRCGYVTSVVYDLLYHDMEGEYMVWLRNPEENGDIVFEKGALDLPETMMKSYRLRIVMSLNQLTEKIRIFDSGLDDRVLELMKTAYFKKFDADLSIESILFVEVEKENGENKDLTFVQLDSVDEDEGFFIEWDGYLKSADLLHNQIGVRAKELGKWQIVDSDYWREVNGEKPKVNAIQFR